MRLFFYRPGSLGAKLTLEVREGPDTVTFRVLSASAGVRCRLGSSNHYEVGGWHFRTYGACWSIEGRTFTWCNGWCNARAEVDIELWAEFVGVLGLFLANITGDHIQWSLSLANTPARSFRAMCTGEVESSSSSRTTLEEEFFARAET